MDYGAVLKSRGSNPGRRSAHYVRQGPFAGSNRQVRGQILKQLLREGMLEKQSAGYRIAGQ